MSWLQLFCRADSRFAGVHEAWGRAIISRTAIEKVVVFPPQRISRFEQGGCSMPTFICYLNWTEQGAKAAKDAPRRAEATQSLIAGLGGRLVCGYVTTGQYDVVLVVDMPNGDAMTKLAIALQTRGNVRTTTVRAFSPEEFGKLAAEAP